MSKKSRKRNKKILAALALAGGAAMLAKGRGKGKIFGRDPDAVSTAGQAFGVDRITPQSKYIQKKVKADVAAPGSSFIGGGIHQGKEPKGNIMRQARIDALNTAEGPPSIDNPYRTPRSGPGPRRFKGGGIAKRGTGAAYKSGGRVKSMGIAKRGGGAAKR